jgi:hypothetical protein
VGEGVKRKQDQWQLCNVVREGETGRTLWQFRPRGGSCTLARELNAVGSERLPPKAVTKDFQSAFQRKLNIAWLPPDDVFLSVVELPATDPAELQGMLELQLERLSPLPAAQTAWTFVPLPRKEDAASTRILLVVASRHAVEAFLGRLETESYLADRLELPQIDELLGCLDQGDGVWVFPRKIKDRLVALVAWLVGGELRHVGLTFLPETGWEEVVKGQLAQVVWSAELDGWLPAQSQAHLVAGDELAGAFGPVLREFTGRDVRVIPPPTEPALAQATAWRARDPQPVALLPVEFSTRYRQVFVDRIWMRSLGTVVLFYLFGVIGYFAAIEWAKYQRDDARSVHRTLAQSYTNALQLAQRVQILQNQMNLKYAALDSFKAVAEKLPDGLTLTSFNFLRNGKVQLFGTAPQTDAGKVTAFAGDLRSAEANGRRLFSDVSSPNINVLSGPTPQYRWDFEADLATATREPPR